MKTLAKIVCCAVALVWMVGATAEEEALGGSSAGESQATEAAPAQADDPAGNASGAPAADSAPAAGVDGAAGEAPAQSAQ